MNVTFVVKTISTVGMLLFFKTTELTYICWTQRFEKKKMLNSYQSKNKNI